MPVLPVLLSVHLLPVPSVLLLLVLGLPVPSVLLLLVLGLPVALQLLSLVLLLLVQQLSAVALRPLFLGLLPLVHLQLLFLVHLLPVCQPVQLPGGRPVDGLFFRLVLSFCSCLRHLHSVHDIHG